MKSPWSRDLCHGLHQGVLPFLSFTQDICLPEFFEVHRMPKLWLLRILKHSVPSSRWK